MSIKKSLIKNTGFNLGGYIYLLLASFFSISVLLQNLGRDVFGIFVFLSSVIPLAAVFDFGLSIAVIRKLSHPQTSDEEKRTTWQTSFAVFFTLALIIFVSILCLLYYLSYRMPIFSHIDRTSLNISILTISVITFVNHLNSHFLTLPQAEQRFDIFNSKTLLVGTANTIGSAIVSHYYPNLAAIYLLQLLFHLLTLAFVSHYAFRHFTWSNFLPKFDKQSSQELLSFGTKNFIGVLASQLENQISGFILGTMVSARAITSFSIPQNIVMKGAGVVSQFAQAFFPLSTSLLAKDRIKKLQKLVLGLEGLVALTGLMAIMATFTLGQPFLAWWLRDAAVVESAYPILKTLSFYFLLIALTPIPTALVQGLNKPQVASFFAVLTVSLEILLALTLVPVYGGQGMALAFLYSAAVSVPAFLVTSWILLSREVTSLTST